MQRTPNSGSTDSRPRIGSLSSVSTALGSVVFCTWAMTSCTGGTTTDGTRGGGDSTADETASGKTPSESDSAAPNDDDQDDTTSTNASSSTQATNATATEVSTTDPSGPTTSGDSTSTTASSTTTDGTTDPSADESGESGGVVTCDASAAPAITQLGLETVVQDSALTILVYAAQPPGSDDWYLVDALGYVRVFTQGALQPTPFLDVSAEMQNSTFTGSGAPSGGASNYDERGLLSIAFAPDYATSGKFYVTLIPTSGSAIDHDLVLEYTRDAENPLIADPMSRRAILDLEPGGMGYSSAPGVNLAKYHNGSTVLFGPDGMLYVGMGDGGGECNSARANVPQETNNPYGKILRLDPNGEPPLYAAPGNPFAADGDARVLHWGLRNPFRFSFDSATGDLYIGDVGQWNHEEISYAPAGSQGLNFGWPDYEGNDAESCQTNISLAQGATHTPPIFDLPHTNGGAQNLLTTIVGGTVYRGTAIPELRGAYLFAEFYPNRPLRALYQCGDQTSEITTIEKRCDPNRPDVACFVSVGNAPALAQVAAIVRGNDGELYIPANGNALLKIVPAP